MKIGIVGIYYGDNIMQGFVEECEAAGLADNIHLLCLDGNVPDKLAKYTRYIQKGKKFGLMNLLVQYVMDCDYVLFTDDDVKLPKGFFPGYLNLVVKHRLDLAQPALTQNSHFSHRITVQLRSCRARTTTFVEIGPLFSMKKEFFHNNIPFPDTMGHGLDYWWVFYAAMNGYRIGIVDEYAVEHNYRPVGKNYSQFDARVDMMKLMATKQIRTIPEQRTLECYY